MTGRPGPGPDLVPPAQEHSHLTDVTAAFERVTGTCPEGVWAAPGRVNLVGEHLDYNGGPVLPLAIAHRGLVAARRRDDGVLRLVSAQDDAVWEGSVADLVPGAVPGWAGYAAGVLWALGRGPGGDLPGFDVVVDGRVPVGAGLSSSASLTCGVAVAVADLLGLPGADAADEAGRRVLAAACVRAENEFAGAPTGGMDQAVVLRARAGHALLLDCRTFDAEHVPLPTGEAGQAELLVVDTRAHHALVDGRYGGRRAACERAAADLGLDRLADLGPDDLEAATSRLGDDELRRVVRHVVSETDRVHRVAALLRAGDLAATGPLLLASHASMRDDFRISVAELDLVVEASVDAGALGARMTGGGFGGSAVVLCTDGTAEAVGAAVHEAFLAAGFTAPGLLPVTASAAAGRVA
ncbi:galactokinase [Aquipuribacter sp. MA13-6]|uniref:galactokinase n=1 Tax=unclassified Aquipuribacter TaxID=2635084 RepID=UPI003EEB36E6